MGSKDLKPHMIPKPTRTGGGKPPQAKRMDQYYWGGLTGEAVRGQTLATHLHIHAAITESSWSTWSQWYWGGLTG